MPLPVLEKVRNELADYRGKGVSIMEMSHRSPEYTDVNNQAIKRFKRLLNAGDEWDIVFLQGGASSQFMMVPFNYLNSDRTADYIDTGKWSANAIKEAKLFGNVHVPFSSRELNYSRIPKPGELNYSDSPHYVHFTSNNTIFGTQFTAEPDVDAPLVCDASSDFLSRPVGLDRYGLIYAGAQKNLGPAGVTIVMIKKSFADTGKNEGIPTILNYKTHLAKIFNTPPVFAVYMVNYVLEWIEEQGGLDYFEKINNQKADLLYSEIDKDNFYRGTAEKESRSKMNVTFRLESEQLESEFVKEAENNGLVALKGHRSVGGIRASIYNACGIDSVRALVSFMDEFRNKLQP